MRRKAYIVVRDIPGIRPGYLSGAHAPVPPLTFEINTYRAKGEIMQNLRYLMYTMEHRRALVFVINKVVTDETLKCLLLKRAKDHDLDKAFLYTMTGKKQASEYHKRTSGHHMHVQNKKKHDLLDFAEAVVDWESAGYTKPDKSRNAYDTLMNLTFTNKEECLEIMRQWGIDSSYKNTPEDADWKSYVSTLPPVTETMILEEIMDWVRRNPERAIECLNYAASLKKTLRYQNEGLPV